MNKKITKFAAIALVVLMLPVSTFAASFKDISNKHWAKTYIEQCADLGFINGFPDGTFKPNAPIRFTELVKMLSNFLNVSEADMQVAESTYGATLNSLKPTAWVRPYLLKCLSKDVISVDLLNNAAKSGSPSMIKDNAQYPFSRSDTTMLFCRAMGLDPVATNLTYKDTEKIKTSVIPYIGALQKVGVLNPKGDENGNFRPTDPLSRAEVAKMLYVANSYIQANGNKLNDNPTPVPTTPTAPSNLENVMGVVKSMFGMGSGQNYITINTPNNELKVYNFPANANIKVNGKTSTTSNVKEGMEAVLTISGETVYSGEFKDAIKNIEGTIKEIRSNNYDAKIEYKENNSTKTITLDFRNADIKLDGKTARFDELREGYEVKVTYSEDKATKVEAKKNITFAGFFEKFEYDSRNREYRVYYRPDSNSSRSEYYVLDDNVYINKSNRSISARSLTSRNGNTYFTKGQPVSFEFYRGKNDIVTGIYYDFDGNVKDGNIYGYIYNDVRRNYSTIDISPKLYKDTRRSEYISINIDSYTDVYAYNSNRRLDLINLRRDMLVNIKMKNGVATSIEILNNTYDGIPAGTYVGELYQIYSREGYIDLDTSVKSNYYYNSYDNAKIENGPNQIPFDDYKTKFYLDGKAMSITQMMQAIENRSYNVYFEAVVKVELKDGKYIATEVNATTKPFNYY